ncbi:MAG: low molecular weight phosphotyrosine protein phosphatase [Oceanospirillaceae bacterium]|nr:low molecular weight phosphotyrosine protein phosphatase [Oceanospirillaceae bacterium]
MKADKIEVLFVCLGNICRSPTAQAVFAKKVQDLNLSDRIEIDSAGTGAYHVGSSADARAIRIAAVKGYDLSQLRARQVSLADFSQFDYIIAMDRQNLAKLEAIQPPLTKATIRLLTLPAPNNSPIEIPDPFYGANGGFDDVLNLLEISIAPLLDEIIVKLS